MVKGDRIPLDCGTRKCESMKSLRQAASFLSLHVSKIRFHKNITGCDLSMGSGVPFSASYMMHVSSRTRLVPVLS